MLPGPPLQDIDYHAQYMRLDFIVHAPPPPRQPSEEEEAVSEEEAGETTHPTPSPETAPYFNSVYNKWRRGRRVWFQVTMMYPKQGYMVDYSTVPVSLFRWTRRSREEDSEITPLPPT